ncbi:AAA family ATPase [Streptomyces candidus]|uniref:Nuclease SbcCD subunit C n=1 Tax=Streptomyces candidus TaxID=67283 RepID=A0A7X0HHH7_9ACTN|nr:SMC family ATPase [Streptomyces candidus]MBB6437751.1 exonuclease SbcC [Streptomyces candidus]GHH50347.1 nuclease SbcCD subunit C [Streptomyces candidus]
MRLHSLLLTAFGPFGATQKVDFDALSSGGLFLLHGPTGAGKTSVLDAVCFALYGSVPGAREGRGLTLRSDHAPPGVLTEVVLELTVGGRRLAVTRRPAQLRPKKGRRTGFVTEKAQSWLSEYDAQTGQWQALSRSHQEIGEEITQLVGMNREQFCQVVLLPQGDFARFLRADAEARGKLLGKLFDTRRFAAVEERLADLRRTAEQQVKAGDDRLLALAERTAEAAGPAAADWPRPEERPGDPGLAASVLTWAAVARSGAVERRDIAAWAVAAAESRQAAARRALEEQRELLRLQERYADTRRRADALDSRREEYERWCARQKQARAADRVAPALAVRDAADREHRAAARAYEDSRAQLPPALMDAGADQLAERERRIRQELGGLDAARRAERRSADIAAERAALDREARADDELRQDADDWLAEWDSVRQRHQERIEAAQEAATRAGHLESQLEPARARLDAARRRDGLAEQADLAAQELQAAGTAAGDARERWLDLRERRLSGIAAELAAQLADGEACKVCGATEHPAPARAGAGHVDRTAEQEAEAEYGRADESRARAESDLSRLRENLAAAQAAAGDASVAELAAHAQELQRDYATAHARAGDMHAAREALDRAEGEYTRRLEDREQAARRSAARTSHREALDRELAALAQELTRVRGEAGSVEERFGLLRHRAELLAGAAETVRAYEATAQRLKEADGVLADAAFKAGFVTPQDAADALLDDVGHRDLQHRIDAWQSERAAVAERLRESDAAEAAARPAADPQEARVALDAAERAQRDATSAYDSARERCAALTRLARQAEAEAHRLGPLREEYERVARLAGLTAGTSADNERRMRLESYVLAARLEQVAAAATARLHRMSDGRYTLVHSDERTAGSGTRRAGLGLHVVDSWTGRERDTSTLSGGETFFASLALALGLADVVTDEAGGVRLDTLFIDEGFGSLDEATLDEVIDVLDALRERNRSVGIVSHVADLRQRIGTRLEIVKERNGSAVRHHL